MTLPRRIAPRKLYGGTRIDRIADILATALERADAEEREAAQMPPANETSQPAPKVAAGGDS